MIARLKLLTLLGVVLLSGCASTFTTKWKDPNATPLEFKGQKVAAYVLMKGDSARRVAEGRLAQQLAVRGVEGRTMYSLVPDAGADNEPEMRAALERAGIKGVIVMRPVKIDKKAHITEPYQEQSYASFWGGYYGYGFSMSYSSGSTEPTVSETTVVYVETLVYSLAQNKLVWGGVSKTTNPETVTELIEELTAAAARELSKEGLIAKQ